MSYIQKMYPWKVYYQMHFDRYIHACSHHPNQGTKHFYYPLKFPCAPPKESHPLPTQLIWFLSLMITLYFRTSNGLSTWLSGRESTCQCRRHRRCGFNPWVRRIPWRQKSSLQYSCLENPKERGNWQATVQMVKKSQAQLSTAPRTTWYELLDPSLPEAWTTINNSLFGYGKH